MSAVFWEIVGHDGADEVFRTITKRRMGDKRVRWLLVALQSQHLTAQEIVYGFEQCKGLKVGFELDVRLEPGGMYTCGSGWHYSARPYQANANRKMT
jgi:hypothetical protein